MADTTRIVDTPEWAALAAHHATLRDVHLRTLFRDDPSRGERLTATAAGGMITLTDAHGGMLSMEGVPTEELEHRGAILAVSAE